MTDAPRYFEDIKPGETATSQPYEVTREAIMSFATQYDPQPFHLDEHAAAASPLDGLAASGWHTAAIGMRLYYDAFLHGIASMGAPGLDEVRWLRPVRPGDRLAQEVTVLDTRASRSRPDRGFLSMALNLRNATGDSVMTARFAKMVQRRGTVQSGGGAPPAPLAEAMRDPEADLSLAAFYEDLAIGERVELGAQHVTADAIVAFAQAFDPHDFHVDAEAAKASHFGGLVASGWQTAAFWMKTYIAARERSASARAAAGLPVAVGGPSPGFVDLKWLRPVYAGQTVHYALTVTNKRALPRPGWSLLTTENTGRLADGTEVLSFKGRMLWPLATT